MFSSLTLGKIAGVTVRIHATFWLLGIYVVISALSQGAGAAGVAVSAVAVAVVFGVVVLHELGHALAARYYGVQTRDITLYPIGGVASLERMPHNPMHELVIAIAGPMVNVVLAALAFLLLQVSSFSAGLTFFLQQFLSLNIILTVFNLLPAFPMDGGRVLRSLLARKINRYQATRVAVSVGKIMAILFFIAGLTGFYGGINLIIIGAFVWIAGQSELRMEAMRYQYQRQRDGGAGPGPFSGSHTASRVPTYRIVED